MTLMDTLWSNSYKLIDQALKEGCMQMPKRKRPIDFFCSLFKTYSLILFWLSKAIVFDHDTVENLFSIITLSQDIMKKVFSFLQNI